jgi:hypothetical protein
MCYQHATTFAERDRFVQLHQAGLTYAEIARHWGWKPETVRKHCLGVAHAGVPALTPHRPGPVPQGRLSRFEPVVRWAALRLKRQHPAWGPAVILDELQQRTSTRGRRLPHISQLAAYLQQFGARLVQPQRHLQLPPPVTALPAPADRVMFELDMQERLFLPTLGYFNVLNIRAPRWGLTVGCYPHPAGQHRWSCKVGQAAARDDCRQTFEDWGLPDEIQTDHDKVLVGTGDYPFPSLFTLWLVGLGIAHGLIQRVTQNGSVERYHRTFDKQMLSGVDCADWPAFLAHVAAEQTRLNARVPSRAKACHGQPPLVAHPEALIPGRPYRCAREADRFDMQRVYQYLAGGRWVRHASPKGQFKFADRVWSVGTLAARQPLVITFQIQTRQFVVSSANGTELKHLPSDWLTEAAIRGLPESEVVKVQSGGT